MLWGQRGWIKTPLTFSFEHSLWIFFLKYVSCCAAGPLSSVLFCFKFFVFIKNKNTKSKNCECSTCTELICCCVLQLFLYQLLRGLGYCHERRILHRWERLVRHNCLCLMGTQACVFSLKPAALLHARGASAFLVVNNLGGEERGGKEGGGEGE